MEISADELKEITRLRPSSATGKEFVTLFSYLMDPKEEEIILSDEVDEVIICSLDKIVEDVGENGESYSPAFIEALNRFLALEKNLES